jgi:hypothetical protein
MAGLTEDFASLTRLVLSGGELVVGVPSSAFYLGLS